MKYILAGQEARNEMIKGVDLVANSVKMTLGPSGKNVFIRTLSTTEPFTTKDGATVAREISTSVPAQQLAVECMQQVSNQSESQAGDGTTTASVLTQSILKHFYDKKHDENYNVIDFKKGLNFAAKKICHHVQESSVQINDESDYSKKLIRDIAMVSSNNDEEIAGVVLGAFNVSKDEGIVNIQRSATGKTELKIVDGLVLPIGYKNTAFINNKSRQTCELKDPLVLMTNIKMDSINDNFYDILDICNHNDQSILIMANDIQDDVLELVVQNVLARNIKACVCRALGFGKEQSSVLDDLGVMFGKVPFLEDNGKHWNHIDLPKADHPNALEILKEYLPQVKEVTLTDHSTSIKTYEFTDEISDAIKERIAFIERLIDDKPLTQEYERNFLKSRKSRLNNGICYINLSANSEMEYVEKQHRVEDTLHSVKWAYAKGVVAGGGSFLYFLSKTLNVGFTEKASKEKIDGANSLISSLESVFNQILSNSGITLTSDELEEIGTNHLIGYDARLLRLGDMFKFGIVDSSHVLMTAIKNAATVAGDIISTDLIIVDDELYKERKSLL